MKVAVLKQILSMLKSLLIQHFPRSFILGRDFV